MSGDCPECGGVLIWGGMRYVPHTQEAHERARRRLYGAFRRLMDRETDLRLWVAENATQGFVGIRWRCGVYPRQIEERQEIPFAYWDDLVRTGELGFVLRVMRSYYTQRLEEQYGVKVNPATWFHKVYDPREKDTI